ncbi:hypothetical protein HMN09_00565400 [Mycena chlorophos]|uniref:Sulfotransferase family protein n=1 Tax=Mycena chlorophos TaxID=658473 RepID=A0A8H6WJ00_MYCCL|nr:hypothetical protein HMN09_00565400 [Mycena chlorophos]
MTSMPQVLVLGFCRTGTASMRLALNTLGFGSAHHIGRVMNNSREINAWINLMDAKFVHHQELGRAELDPLLAEFRVVADVPGLLFAKELVEAYPDARVILTLRDPDTWLRSMQATLIPMLAPPPFALFTRIACLLDPSGLGRFIPFARRTLELVLGPLDEIRNNPETAKGRYLAYNDDIRALVPPDRLLEYHIGRDGWAPLCAFLGREVPEALDFPHRNDARSIMDGSRKQIWGIYRRFARRAAAFAVVAISLWIGFGQR